ncbi:DEAD/DEAH box helicase [Streptomyces sp. MUM 203J]|uniref:DEAD/DEAH box helicase n=1 Tax=Streptomyces sp. MUM 203J TaxID=2791990 RepID=UPI001F039D25|nr:DEAD/DEAH box helicase [Streptomyces sp. MUM 203J]MCH0540125.1 DEAD/DEAH box helicase [Streptomyces sp. MUM 203J]
MSAAGNRQPVRGGGAAPAAGRAARELLGEARQLYGAARTLMDDHRGAVDAVRAAHGALNDELVGEELARIPVRRIQEATEGRVQVARLEAAGYATLLDVHGASPHRLERVPGLGRQGARRVRAATDRLVDAVRDLAVVRLDPDDPQPRTTALARALYPLVKAGPDARRAMAAAEALVGDMDADALLSRAGAAGSRMRMLFTRREGRRAALEALARVRDLLEDAARDGVPLLVGQVSVDLLRVPDEVEAWVDFEARSGDYYAALAPVAEAELRGGRAAPHRPAAAEGFLPPELAERVRAQELDDIHLRVSLRGYQAFGARFALAQRRVILGDEMGLGKTVQAVAAIAHLAAQGETHFLVVCPASVLINWMREIQTRSTLRPVRLHGPERGEVFTSWREHGGVAVTTYEALRGFPVPEKSEKPDKSEGPERGEQGRPALLVVDEAHYVKNPQSRRSQAVAAWSRRCERVLFLTGTPMENRVTEFRNLVRPLQPELLPQLAGVDVVAVVDGSQAFRTAVAPAYLRRNQEDVLTELPGVVRVDEWEELSRSDRTAYGTAVASGRFPAIRRAAYARRRDSAKLARLREIVADAADNGLKVVVFSYFREVLTAVRNSLGPSRTLGPLSGSLSVEERQELVDAFAARQGHVVLLAQIQAGGVGLNLQAASVVILCEPQTKPTLEYQAVARVHRMGQVRSVRVHRLLATDSVDERLVTVLEGKSRLFDAYARRSDVAEALPEAVDVSDGALARRIVEEEQARLGVEGRA